MNQLYQTLSNHKTNDNKEDGFTLLELMVVMLVIGILSSLAFLVASDQIRQAVIATVKNDVSSNKSVMAPGSGDKIYSPIEKFVPSAASTDLNETFYVVAPNNMEACTHTIRKFADDDIVVYRFWTKIGKMEPEYCPELGGESVIIPGDESPEEPTPEETETPSPEPTEEPEEETSNPENGNTTIDTDPIKPNNSVTTIQVNMVSNESYRVCYEIKINTTSTTGAPWSVIIDRTVPPFHAPNFLSESGNDSRYVMQDFGTHYTLYGKNQLELASTTKSFTPRVCTKAPEGKAIIADMNPAEVTHIGTPTGGEWNGTQDFTIENDTQYYSGWEVQVDLKDLKSLVSARPDGQAKIYTSGEIFIEKVNGTIYRVWGNKMTPSLQRDKPFTFRVGWAG